MSYFGPRGTPLNKYAKRVAQAAIDEADYAASPIAAERERLRGGECGSDCGCPPPTPPSLADYLSGKSLTVEANETPINFFQPERSIVDAPLVVYVSGPMEGRPGLNFAAFNEAADILRELGYEVMNPAENFEGRKDIPREQCLRLDVSQMATQCNAILMLDGWQNSAGARLEYLVAQQLGFTFVQLEGDTVSIVEPVELEASRIVRNGERQKNYGHPNQDFTRTAAFWTAILRNKLAPEEEVTMQDLALMMASLKISRLVSTPGHHDSLVDMIGYAICYDRLGE